MDASVNWPLIIAALKENGMTVKEIALEAHLPRSVINALAHGYVGLYPEYYGQLVGVYRNLPVRSGE
ncbi:transcriptional regulator [Salmonella enterica]|nr:transcriptional regulator [Salmonella enterica]